MASSAMASSVLRRILRRSIFPSSSSSTIRCYYYSSSSSSSSILGRGVLTAAQSSLMTKKKSPCSYSLTSLRFIASSKKKKVTAAVAVDENLKRVLDSEIECQENQQDSNRMVTETPEGFPFEIVDNPGDQTIILKRDFAGENIQITVLMNDKDEMENDEDESEDDNNNTLIQPTLSLVVNVDKGAGHTVEFCCNLSSDELSIESMEMKKSEQNDNEEAYNGPEFTDLDESLQKALHKYLKERGIKGSLFDFLHEYMMNKDEREYLLWLKNMKGFIES